MLKTTTRTAIVTKSNVPANVKMTPNTNVDKPKIMANVATMESRSFHKFMNDSLFFFTDQKALITFIPY